MIRTLIDSMKTPGLNGCSFERLFTGSMIIGKRDRQTPYTTVYGFESRTARENGERSLVLGPGIIMDSRTNQGFFVRIYIYIYNM